MKIKASREMDFKEESYHTSDKFQQIRIIKFGLGFWSRLPGVGTGFYLKFTKLQYVFLLLSLQGHYRVTDED